MSIHQIAARGKNAAAWSVAGSIGKVLGQLIVQITLVRLLDPHAVGAIAAMSTVIALSALVMDGGIGAGLIFKQKLNESDIQFAYTRTFVLGALVGVLIMSVAPVLAGYFGDNTLEPMFIVCGVLVVTQGPMNIALSLLRRNLDYRQIHLIHLIAYIPVYGGIAILLALLGWGAWSFLAGYFLQSIFTFAAASITCKFNQLRFRGDRELVRFGLKSMATDISTWSMETLDSLLVGRLVGLHSLGLYTVAMNLCRAPTAIIGYALQNILFSTTSRLQDEQGIVRNGYLLVLNATSLCMLPMYAIVSYNAEAVLDLIYGSKWTTAAPLFAALAVAMPMAVMGSITAAVMRGLGAVASEMRTQLICTTLLVVGFLSLIALPLGLVVWTVPLVYSCRLLILIAMIRRRLEIKINTLLLSLKGGIILGAVGLAVSVITETMVGHYTSTDSLIPFLVSGLVTLLFCLYRFTWLAGDRLAEAAVNSLPLGPWIPYVRWLTRDKRVWR